MPYLTTLSPATDTARPVGAKRAGTEVPPGADPFLALLAGLAMLPLPGAPQASAPGGAAGSAAAHAPTISAPVVAARPPAEPSSYGAMLTPAEPQASSAPPLPLDVLAKESVEAARLTVQDAAAHALRMFDPSAGRNHRPPSPEGPWGPLDAAAGTAKPGAPSPHSAANEGFEFLTGDVASPPTAAMPDRQAPAEPLPTKDAGAPPAASPPAESAAAGVPVEAAGLAVELGAEMPASRALPTEAAEPVAPGRPDMRALPALELGADGLGRPIKVHVAVEDHADGRRIAIGMEPADLGRVEVSLALDDRGQGTATFTVERIETLHLLQRESRAITDLLNGNGVSVGPSDIGFTLRDGGREGRPGQQQAEQREPSGERSANSSRSVVAQEGGPAMGLRGLLDLRV